MYQININAINTYVYIVFRNLVPKQHDGKAAYQKKIKLRLFNILRILFHILVKKKC